MKQKYGAALEDDTASGAVAAERIEISGKVVEEVGFDKIRKQQAELAELRIVLVDGICVAGLREAAWEGEAGGEDWKVCLEQIERTCPSIVELDLSRGLVERWVDVVGIFRALKGLRSLTLK